MTNIQAQLPLTIISGYLGSGKTTLVNHLLRNANGRRLMVLVNDFGELPIDADLIQSQDGNTINLANGCACCSMGGDLFNALVDVLDMSPWPDHLLIEASGVADPARIANIALAEPDLKLDAIISLVDAETFEGLIDDLLIGETIKHQLASSDIILLNKLDLVGDEDRSEIEKALESIAPKARTIETRFANVPIELIIGVNLLGDLQKEMFSLSHDHAKSYSKWSKVLDRDLNKGRLEKALGGLGSEVLRLKGIVYFDDIKVPHIVQYVGTRFTITPSENFNETPNDPTKNQSRLVAIGLVGKLDTAKLDALFSVI